MNALDWLLDADPAIRCEALRDLTDAPGDEVAAERARVATQGWGARLLALRREDGLWDIGKPDTEWPTLNAFLMLREMGLDPASEEARKAIGAVRDTTWHNPWAEWDGQPVLEGEIEPCINGRVVTVGSYFGLDVSGIVERLLGEQMADGGWNCDQVNGSTRGAFATTINVLEGLSEHERSTGASAEVAAALERGQAYLLDRRMLRRLSTGQLINPEYSLFSFPTGYHYDALRGLDHLRAAGVAPDARVDEAIDEARCAATQPPHRRGPSERANSRDGSQLGGGAGRSKKLAGGKNIVESVAPSGSAADGSGSLSRRGRGVG